MRIQFELGMPSHERHFQTVLEELSKRGHEVIKTSSTQDCPGLIKKAVKASDHRELVAFHTYVRNDAYQSQSYVIRSARDYIRYLLPEHSTSMIIKSRVKNMLLLGFEDSDFLGSIELESFLNKIHNENALHELDVVLNQFEAMIPPCEAVVEYMKALDPDLVCITPMIITQYGQVELVKAAKQLKIPVVFLVNSWDNLTTKGAIHVMPDVILVWNEVQRSEAVRFHGVPSENVVVTGASRFDDFWERKIEITRLDYCKKLGLDPSQPIITYLCSSNLISHDEKDFVHRWVEAIRTSKSYNLASINIVIRPHPKFSDGWTEQFSGMRAVAIAASKGLNNDPVLFHCLAHARAVVGANTSAELEAAILNVPVFTVHDADLETGQKGTIHFGYLAGKLAMVAQDLSEHILQLEAELTSVPALGRNNAFLTDFLRPCGLNTRATDVTVDYLESMQLFKRMDLKVNPIHSRCVSAIFKLLGLKK